MLQLKGNPNVDRVIASRSVKRHNVSQTRAGLQAAFNLKISQREALRLHLQLISPSLFLMLSNKMENKGCCQKQGLRLLDYSV